jgi:hypothetical protein
MPKRKSGGLTVTVSGPVRFIQVPTDRAMDLHRFLRKNGISSLPPSPCSADIDSIELGKGVDPKEVQILLDKWSS